jgi:hypothetical protein
VAVFLAEGPICDEGHHAFGGEVATGGRRFPDHHGRDVVATGLSSDGCQETSRWFCEEAAVIEDRLRLRTGEGDGLGEHGALLLGP